MVGEGRVAAVAGSHCPEEAGWRNCEHRVCHHAEVEQRETAGRTVLGWALASWGRET